MREHDTIEGSRWGQAPLLLATAATWLFFTELVFKHVRYARSAHGFLRQLRKLLHIDTCVLKRRWARLSMTSLGKTTMQVMLVS